MKVKFKIKRRTYYLVSTLLIFFGTIFCLNLYNKYSNDSLKKVATQNFQKEIYESLDKSIKANIAENDLSEILKIYQNSRGEIMYADYDLSKSYKMLGKVSSNIKNTLHENEGITLKFPFLLGSKNVLFNNFGPKITVKINYINAVLANIDTKITNYGLNNALVESYIKISVEGLIVTPVSEEKTTVTYKFLISSKLINGKVPSLYGDYITSSSSLFDIPLS